MTSPNAPHMTPSATTGPGPSRSPWPTIGSVVALVAGLLATLGLLLLSFVLALCGLAGSGEECTDEYQAAWVAVAGAVAVFLGVPALVAALRRDARWLLVPMAQAGAVGLCALYLSI